MHNSTQSAKSGVLIQKEFEEIWKSADSILRPLSKKGTAKFIYEFLPPSQFNSRLTQPEYMEKQEDGKFVVTELGAKLRPTEDEVRAVAYRYAQDVSEFKAFSDYKIVQLTRLHQSIELLLNHNHLGQAISLMRNTMEHIGQYSLSEKRVTEFFSQNTSDREKLYIDIGGEITKTFSATRINWPAVYGEGIKSKKAEKFKYRKDDYRADMEAANLLNSIDHLNKLNPGARLAYDVMCEFTHPNIGNLYATIEDQKIEEDKNGIIRVVRTLGSENPKASIQTLNPILSDLFEHYLLSLRQFEEKLKQMRIREKEFQRIIRYFLRRLYKHHIKLFDQSTLCHCVSGKRIRQCCGKSK